MPVRSFAPTGHIELAVGASNVSANATYAGIINVPNLGAEFMFSMNEPAVLFYSWGIEGGLLTMYNGGGTRSPFELPSNQWLFVAMTKAAGNNSAKAYMYNFETEEWTIATCTGVIGNGGASPSSLSFGEWDGGEQFRGKIAAQAVWDTVLSEAQIKELAEGVSIADWLTTSPSPKGLWMFNQAETSEAVLDLTGNGAVETTQSGTTVVEEEPPLPYEEGEEPEPAAPDATTNAATSVTDTTATMNGQVKANGKATDYYYEWGVGEAFDKKKPVSEEGSGGSGYTKKSVPENLTGLAPNTTYKYRLVAKNELGEDTGAVQEFKTEAEGEEEPPTVGQVKVKQGGVLVDAQRYVKVGGELIPA